MRCKPTFRTRTAFPAKQPRTGTRTKRTVVAILVAAAALANVASATAAPTAPVFTGPADGAAINSPTPEFSGIASGDAVLIRIYEGVTPLADTGIAGGYWSVAIALADGTHTIRARARDAGGIWGPYSDPLTITVDTAVPAAPVITAPVDGSVVSFSPVTVEGTSEPGAHIHITVSTGSPLDTIADGAGAWAATRAFTDTTHTIRATATDAAGNESLVTAPVTFRVDTTPPSVPIIYTPGDQTFTDDTTPAITGSAEPGATVKVFEGVTIIMTTVAVDGTWSGAPALGVGAHTITARAFDAAGHASGVTPAVHFTIDVTAPGAPTITSPQPGSVVGYSYSVAGTAEPYATIQLVKNVDVVATTTADAAGRWSVEQHAYSGGQLIKARARDRAGNTGPFSPTVAFTVDAQPPEPPVVTTPNGSIFLPTQTPRIEGRARDDIGVLAISLEYYDLLGQAVAIRNANCFGCPANADVDWQTTYVPPPSGRYVVKVYAVDRAGNRSLPTEISFIRL